MDYFQGVVMEYLRADRACFVNPELWVRGNLEHVHSRLSYPSTRLAAPDEGSIQA